MTQMPPLDQLPPLDQNNVQGDILLDGLPKEVEFFSFFKITNAATLRPRLPDVAKLIASVQDQRKERSRIDAEKAKNTTGIKKLVPSVLANIALSAAGLQKINEVSAASKLVPVPLPETARTQFFAKGMEEDAKELQDPSANSPDKPYKAKWEKEFLSRAIDGVILVAASDQGMAKSKLDEIIGKMNSSGKAVELLRTITGQVRPDKLRGFEHFGFNDGITEPAVADNKSLLDTVAAPGIEQEIIKSGIILCGREGDGERDNRPAWSLDGSFLCFRYLKQLVPEWNDFIVQTAKKEKIAPDKLGALLVGRWRSGAPLPAFPDSDPGVGKFDPKMAFSFYQPDSTQLFVPTRRNPSGLFPPGSSDARKCPLGAHIRKMNPRDKVLSPDVDTDLHRILRRGIAFGPEVATGENKTKADRGLAFACYQSDIGNGFRFIQTSWANSFKFTELGAGLDIFIGQMNPAGPNVTKTVEHSIFPDNQIPMAGILPDNSKPLKISGINPFVVPAGGEYFFMPSLSALESTLAGTATKLKRG